MASSLIISARGILDTLMSYLDTIKDKEERRFTAKLIDGLKIKVVGPEDFKSRLLDFINLVPSVSYRKGIVAKLHEVLSEQNNDTQTADTLQEEFDKKTKEVYDSLEEDPSDPQIDNPTHYQSMVKGLDIDAISCMRAAFGDNDVKAFCLCNSLKYIFRHMSKGGKTDLLKCKWYIDKYLELNEGSI